MFKCLSLFLLLVSAQLVGSAQNKSFFTNKFASKSKDTSLIKKHLAVPAFSFPKVKYVKISDLVANTHPVFSVMAGASFAKQVVNAGGYVSKFNYNVADIQKDNYTPGFFAGVRVDGTYQNKHAYSISASLGKLSSGANYAANPQFSVDSTKGYSSFKAEGQLYVLNIAAHYKKLIPFGNQSNHQLYVVAGPSIGTRLFGTSIDNEVTDAYKRIFFKGDIGLEWNNRKAYTFFLHYQHSLGSMTKSPIQNNLNAFELGVFTAAKEIF
ncbi:MAG: hypothetical protein RLZ56_347 [Bacteroidota bacterium]